MVTETLANGFWISIDTSKESDFNPDFKYISFIKFSPTHQKLRAWENLTDFRKKRERPPKKYRTLMKITPSYSAYQRTLLQKFQAHIYKNMECCIFCQKKDHGCVFICFFSQGWSYRPSGPRISWKGSLELTLKVLVPFLSDEKNGGQLGPLPRSFFSQSHPIKILR